MEMTVFSTSNVKSLEDNSHLQLSIIYLSFVQAVEIDLLMYVDDFRCSTS
jgi:hypothetical protein